MIKKRKLLLGIIAFILVILSIPIIKMKRNPKKALAMPTVEVKKGDISVTVATAGSVETINKQDVFAKTNGVVTYIAKEGTPVKKGDILLEVDNSELLLEQERALYRLEREKTELSKLLVGPKDEEIKKEEIRLSEAKTNHGQALLDYNRNKRLFDEGAISKHELERAEQELMEKSTLLQLAKSNLSLLKNVDPLDVQAKKASVSEAESDYINAKNKAKDTVVYAKIDGIVLNCDASEGMSVSTGGEKIISVGDVSKLQVSCDVNEYDASRIEEGQKAKITGEGFEGMEYEGRVTQIASVATTKQNDGQGSATALKVEIEVTNPDKNIKPGFLANVEINVENKGDVLTIPLECIIEDEKTKKVVTVKDGKHTEKKVKTGIYNELYIEIIEGLSEGEQVLQDPLMAEGEDK